jgi:N-acetylmuramoyl-L-alanine amidase
MSALALANGPPVVGTDLSAVLTQTPTNRPLHEIIVHCTATPEGREVSREEIREWHLSQGWADIAYHYVVHLDGRIERGRRESTVGAHTSGHNTGTLGVVYVGGTDKDGAAKDTRTPAQKESLLTLVRTLRAKYPSITKVSGHNEHAAKACPSFIVADDPLGKSV